MSRPQRESVGRTPALEINGERTARELPSRLPASAPVAPKGYDPTLDSMLKGLSVFNAGLSNYVHGESDRDVEEGMRSRADGSPLSEDKGEWFRHGYMAMDGRVKGQEDGAALREAYETAFDKDGGDVERLIAQQWSERTKGLSDKSFLHGYKSSFAAAAEQLRKAHLTYQQQRVVEKHEANALSLIDSTVRGHIERGEEVPQASLEAVKAELNRYGITRSRFNELLFEAVNRAGMEGNSQVFDLLKRPNADGTPGLYAVPKWRTKIDQAQVHAQNVFLAKQDQASTLARKQREDRQDEALYSVFATLYSGDHQAAQTMFAQHVRNGLFSRASDLVRWQEQLRKVEQRELRPDEQTAMTETLTGIYTGRVGIRDILNSGLPPTQTRQLLTEWRAVQAQERQAAADARASADAPLKSPGFKEQEDWVESELKPAKGLLDPFTQRDQFLASARATAKLELAEYVRASGLKDIRTKAVEIVERHKKRVGDFDAQRLDLAASRLRYSNIGEARAAYERRQMSDVDFDMHLDYFEDQAKQKRAKEARK